ncbi:uncharacterized protein BO80DRAFT_435598 [Aspergillus ibericus CBS 121593]|uniref:Uncharacterized protein n=1 Tax=Aspergillus ibericus CBS 121593 TaxID=1448316 RepID=A0A395GZ03_9EURO|nr:hypothetical protein BO80DRAFT_435598 [Aspergillus ibericus CBS 121593]RAK99907.1 hypothetical protein BO80DRAFT_435598 [Aspergillus ibericus CBS 121593]
MSNKTYEYGELVVTLTTAFDVIWNDKGSGATRDGGTLNGKRAALLVGAKFLTGTSPAVRPPTDYTQLWAKQDSGANADGSFWRPIAPAGYTSMGHVVQAGWSVPSLSKMWCQRRRLRERG